MEFNVQRRNNMKPASTFHQFQGQFREDKESELKHKLPG